MIRLANSSTSYGWLSITLHWLGAILLYGLFGLGLYMVDLSYDHPWYHDAPHWHESIGLVFLGLLILRFTWRQFNPKPLPLADTSLQVILAQWAHRLLYLLMLMIVISGYLISTSDGHDLAFFNWFNVPSLTGKIDGLETISGQFHFWLAVTLVLLSIGHIGAALKHHWIDKDDTLMRMLRTNKTQ